MVILMNELYAAAISFMFECKFNTCVLKLHKAVTEAVCIHKNVPCCPACSFIPRNDYCKDLALTIESLLYYLRFYLSWTILKHIFLSKSNSFLSYHIICQTSCNVFKLISFFIHMATASAVG